MLCAVRLGDAGNGYINLPLLYIFCFLTTSSLTLFDY
jgi:hypothetical protein